MTEKAWHKAWLRPVLFIAIIAVLSKVGQAVAGILIADKFGAGRLTDAYMLAKSVAWPDPVLPWLQPARS